MKNIILFGAGYWGDVAYHKFHKNSNIIFYVDNDQNKVGSRLHNIEIIDPLRLGEIYKPKEMNIIIASRYFLEIEKQLCDMGIEEYYVLIEGFLYHRSQKGEMVPFEMEKLPAYKTSSEKKSILFVQSTACIRTHKIADALKKNGWNVFLMYTILPPSCANPEYESIYDGIYTISSMGQLIEFVNKSDFDVIHSSNEPDYLTMILTKTEKTVIHDCHDLTSAYASMTPEKMCIEFMANRNSSGAVYATEGLRKEAVKKFNVNPERTFVLENLISEELTPEKRHEKISASDEELHCVYEGGVVAHDEENYRYFEKIWLRLAECGIHVHFYTNCERQSCLYIDSLHEKIHYEGNFSSRQLAEEMTKYDMGLCIFNMTDKNRQYLENTSPNKIYEYVNAGIPVAVGDIENHRKVVEENGFGKQIDLNGDLVGQMRKIAEIKIENNILHKKGMTMESKIPELVKFYDAVHGEAGL